MDGAFEYKRVPRSCAVNLIFLVNLSIRNDLCILFFTTSAWEIRYSAYVEHAQKRRKMCLILFFLKVIRVFFKGKSFLFCHFLIPNLTELNVKLVALEREILSIDTFDIAKNH